MADIIASVTSVLRGAGYRTGNANPGSIMPAITEPVVAVNLERANMTARSVVVRVTVVAPLALGARSCEEHGLAVCRLLSNMGGKCDLQPSKFNPKTELFSAAVLVAFQGNVLDENWAPGELCQVRFGAGYYLNKVVSFTSWQEPEEEQTLEESSWKIRVEEQLEGIRPEEIPVNVTKITVIYADSVEVYNECKLIGRKRVIRDGALLQTWEATAQNRTVTT